MTLLEVNERLRMIHELGAEDPESASGEERRLYNDAIAAAIRGEISVEVLQRVQQVKNIPFRRC